jgi:hypothetical protein
MDGQNRPGVSVSGYHVYALRRLTDLPVAAIPVACNEDQMRVAVEIVTGEGRQDVCRVATGDSQERWLG